MDTYFESFKFINYLNSVAINITERAVILNKVFGDSYAFYPYRVKNGMRARSVAERYYGDPNYEWLVYLSNNIVDPYSQWPMDERTFDNYLIDKYGNTRGQDKVVAYRVNWFEDTRKLSVQQYNQLLPNLKKYWQSEFDSVGYPMSYSRKPLEYQANSIDGDEVHLSVDSDEVQYWTAVTAYELEEEDNAKKANIRLLDSRLAPTARSNLRKLLSQ